MNAKAQQNALRAALHASQMLAASLEELTGARGGGVSVPTVPALYLDYLPPDMRGAPKARFIYAMDFDSIAAAGGVGTASFTVQSDSAFLWTLLAAEVTDPAAPETPVDPSGLTITITDEGSGRQFQNRQLGFNTVVGTGQLPAYAPWPAWLDRASQVTASIVNNQIGQDVAVRLSFDGFKIFGRSQAGLS